MKTKKGMVVKMFKNLEAEMTRQNISFEHMAKLLDISYHSFRFKMKGITEWKFSEMVLIKKTLSIEEDLTFEYLFETS